jgi:hypothetical protein
VFGAQGEGGKKGGGGRDIVNLDQGGELEDDEDAKIMRELEIFAGFSQKI